MELFLDSYWGSHPDLSEIVRFCPGLESLSILVEPQSVAVISNLSKDL